MSGVLLVSLYASGLAMFVVWSELLFTAGFGGLVSVPLSTVFLEPFASTYPGSTAGYCQRVWWYRPFPSTHTIEELTEVSREHLCVGLYGQTHTLSPVLCHLDLANRGFSPLRPHLIVAEEMLCVRPVGYCA